MKAPVLPLRQSAAAAPVLSDEAIALACAAADPAAVAALYDRFRGRVTRFLARALASSNDIEDLLQATFLEVARGGARFDGRSSASTWLLGVAANVVRHHLRSRGRQHRLRTALELVHSEAPPAAEPAGEHRVLLGRVERALAGLSPELRLAFVLCEWEGLSARDAAASLGIRETAIWKRVSDARRFLRAALAEEAP